MVFSFLDDNKKVLNVYAKEYPDSPVGVKKSLVYSQIAEIGTTSKSQTRKALVELINSMEQENRNKGVIVSNSDVIKLKASDAQKYFGNKANKIMVETY